MPFSVACCGHAGAERVTLPTMPKEPVPAALKETFCSSCPARDKGLCAALPGAELSALSALSRSKVLASNQTIVREGEHADAIFTVVSGMLKLYKMLPDGRQQITGFANSGDMVGLSFGDSFAYTAETVSAATVCRFPRAQLNTLMARIPQLQGRLLALTSIELTAAQDQILLLGCKNATERICSFLLALARRSPEADAAAPTVFLPMQKMDMSAYLGLRPETLSRQFRKLEDAGLIDRVSAVRIRLNDPAALEDMAAQG
ncbi:MAG TPA: helix-turn-helix domain-containing protein [Azospirillum sp.]|nr:helix-turn-helix domain-containing protein [Azospirillum sp.]